MHDACVLHDHCYHHNPVTYGLSREDCDREFKAEMLQICDRRYPPARSRRWHRRCRRAARRMAFAVSIASGRHYRYSNYRAEYLRLYASHPRGKSAGGVPAPCLMQLRLTCSECGAGSSACARARATVRWSASRCDRVLADLRYFSSRRRLERQAFRRMLCNPGPAAPKTIPRR